MCALQSSFPLPVFCPKTRNREPSAGPPISKEAADSLRPVVRVRVGIIVLILPE